MKKTLVALAAAVMLASTAAMAQSYQPYQYNSPQYNTPRYAQNEREQRWDDRAASINEREARINARIQRGINDGRINEYEARRLYRELRDIEAKERSFKDDGHLNRRETDALNRDLDRLVDHVRQQMRD